MSLKTNLGQHYVSDFNLFTNVTPSKLRIENIEPTNAAEIADIKVTPLIEVQAPVEHHNDAKSKRWSSWHPSPLSSKTKTISPASDKILLP
jgi:hypothetical protein